MSRKLGDIAEDLAAHYLISLGYRIIKSNFQTRNGEIDLIAEKDDEITCFEVKARKNKAFGYPEEAVTEEKQIKIWKTYQDYLDREGIDNDSYGLEVLAINLDKNYNLKAIEKIPNY